MVSCTEPEMYIVVFSFNNQWQDLRNNWGRMFGSTLQEFKPKITRRDSVITPHHWKIQYMTQGTTVKTRASIPASVWAADTLGNFWRNLLYLRWNDILKKKKGPTMFSMARKPVTASSVQLCVNWTQIQYNSHCANPAHYFTRIWFFHWI